MLTRSLLAATFVVANSLDPTQDWQNDGPDLYLKRLTLW